MKPTGILFFVPLFVLIIFLGYGAGTALANSNPGGWNSPEDTQLFSSAGQSRIGIGPLDGAAGLVAAQDSTGTKRRAFVGTVATTGTGPVTGSLTVTLQRQGTAEEVVITLPEGTEIKTPGGPRAGTLTEEARVVILTQQNEGGLVALKVIVKPVKPPFAATGMVTALNGDEVTVESPEGDVQTVILSEDVGEVEAGEVVTVFEDGTGKATGLVKADQVRQRLDQFIKDAEDTEGDEGPDDNFDVRSRRVEALARIIERFDDRHLQVMNGAVDRVPEALRLRIESRKARLERDRRNSREVIQRVRAALEARDAGLDTPQHQDRRPEAATRPVFDGAGAERHRGRDAGEEDGSATTRTKRPETAGGPRVETQTGDGGSDTPDTGQRSGSHGKGRNR